MWNDTIAVLTYFMEKGSSETSTGKIAADVHCSQQTVSRKLKEMEDAGFVVRKITGNGIKVKISEKGLSLLKQQYHLLEHYFGNSKKGIVGTVVSGLGEGKYYMSLQGYKEQFASKLGYTPFEGTLNLQVDKEKRDVFVSSLQRIMISGFVTKERTFGGLVAYPITISVNGKKVEGHVIFPERTTHTKDTAEVIANANLRERLELNDNDEVTLS